MLRYLTTVPRNVADITVVPSSSRRPASHVWTLDRGRTGFRLPNGHDLRWKQCDNDRREFGRLFAPFIGFTRWRMLSITI